MNLSVNHGDHFFTSPDLTTKDESHPEYLKELVHIEERIIKIARENQKEHDIYVIAQISEDYSYTSYFPINSYVLVQYETQKTSKLHATIHGPHRVLNHVGTVHTVEHIVTKVIHDFHVKLLSEYKHNENNMNIGRVAKLDDEYSDIIDILNHRFEPNHSTKRSNLEFLLTWEDDTDPKWYRWNSSLGDNHPKDHSKEIARRKKRKYEGF